MLEFNLSQRLKPYVAFDTQDRIKTGKNDGNNGKALYKLMSNAVNGKTVENLRNRINVRLVSNEKG